MLLLKFEKRLEPGRWSRLWVSIGSIILALVFGGLAILFTGTNPIEAYAALFQGAFGTAYGLSETLVKATPLILCGLSVALCLKMRLWNIGAEGQYVVGFLAATLIALHFPQFGWPVLLPLMGIAAVLAGGIWAGIAGLLKARLGVNEIITTLLMNWIAILLSQYFAYGPLKGTDGFPYSAEFCPAACLARIGWHRVNAGLILAVVAAAVFYWIFRRTVWGFEIGVIGDNEKAARGAGMKIEKNIVLVLFIAGALAALAGFTEAAGIEHRITPHTAAGYGYIAILVAWLARTNPLLVVLVSALFGGLATGGEMIQISMGVPLSVIMILEGAILFFLLAGDMMLNYRVKFGKK